MIKLRDDKVIMNCGKCNNIMLKLRNDEVIMNCKCNKKIIVRVNSDGWYILEDINPKGCGY